MIKNVAATAEEKQTFSLGVPEQVEQMRQLVKSSHTLTVPVPLPLGWTWLQTSSPPGAPRCVTWVQAEVWSRGCSPTCWQARGAPAQEAPAFPQTPLPLTQPPRRSWRRITTGAQSTPESISRSTDTPEIPTVSTGRRPVPSGHTQLNVII